MYVKIWNEALFCALDCELSGIGPVSLAPSVSLCLTQSWAQTGTRQKAGKGLLDNPVAYDQTYLSCSTRAELVLPWQEWRAGVKPLGSLPSLRSNMSLPPVKSRAQAERGLRCLTSRPNVPEIVGLLLIANEIVLRQ